MRKGFNPHAVSPCLRNEVDANRLLHHDYRTRHIRDLVHRERISQLRPCIQILGSVSPGLLS